MTNTNTEPDTSQPPSDPDTLLTLFVLMAEKGLKRMGVTLLVNGLTVSGDIIPTWEFQARWNEIQKAAMKKADVKDHLIGTVLGPFEELAEKMRGDAESSTGDTDVRHFICLENARVILASDAQPMRAPIWRLRLSSVDGWTPGVADVSVR